LEPLFKIFHTPSELAEAFAAELIRGINDTINKGFPFMLAVSGGNTPKLLFSILAEKYSLAVNWDNVHFFWVDERCVPPVNTQSNYGMTKQILFDKINIPERNIHRMRGEDDPVEEAARYTLEILSRARSKKRLPVFDHIILGMGEDGHTASIFPGNLELVESEEICKTSVHPISGQRRITLTGKVINNADFITFMVTGQNKSRIIEEIFNKNPQYVNYPASYIIPSHGTVRWLLDDAAGELIG
jgi:6-phosphogluconolactonase